MLSDSTLLNDTDQCVMCGLCLPHCPTYRISRHEGESPRGRISLVKAYVQGELAAGPALQAHLQSCTSCMKCEQVCPANVAYQSIIDAGRQRYRSNLDFKTRILQRLGIFLLTGKWGHRTFKFLQIGSAILSRFKFFSGIETLQLAKVLQKRQMPSVAIHETHFDNEVTLFSGCSAQLLDGNTFADTIRLLASLGYRARLPQQTLCCSALAQHSGFADLAHLHRQQTKEHLRGQEVISFASGCGRQLDIDGVQDIAHHYDIHSWLLQKNKLGMLRLKPLAKKVLQHTPCSMQSHQGDAMTRVLRAIPGLRLQRFDDNLFCCGAGGMQILTPQTSNQALLQSKITTVKALQPDLIVSANAGCALHLQKGLQRAGMDLPVIHTATLLAKQIQDQ